MRPTTRTLDGMECWLSGGYALDDEGEHVGRALTVQLTASRPSLRRALHERCLAVPVRGELSAEQLAERAGCVVAGTIEVGLGGARYGLRFDDDQGSPCELRGTQELSLRRPPRGFSVVAGELLRDERRIGSVKLRLDPRDGVKGLFRWAS